MVYIEKTIDKRFKRMAAEKRFGMSERRNSSVLQSLQRYFIRFNSDDGEDKSTGS